MPQINRGFDAATNILYNASNQKSSGQDIPIPCVENVQYPKDTIPIYTDAINWDGSNGIDKQRLVAGNTSCGVNLPEALVSCKCGLEESDGGSIGSSSSSSSSSSRGGAGSTSGSGSGLSKDIKPWECKPIHATQDFGARGGCKPLLRVSRSSIICDPKTKEFCCCGKPEPSSSDLACVSAKDNKYSTTKPYGCKNVLIKKHKLKPDVLKKIIGKLKKNNPKKGLPPDLKEKDEEEKGEKSPHLHLKKPKKKPEAAPGAPPVHGIAIQIQIQIRSFLHCIINKIQKPTIDQWASLRKNLKQCILQIK